MQPAESTNQSEKTKALAPLPEQEISGEVLIEKYAKGQERTVEDVRRRVARALALVEAEEKRAQWEAKFYDAQERGFIPAGRINSAAGTTLTATLINCFVQPVGDSITEVVDGQPGIYTALAEAAETMRRGGGVGYDFSSIRPQGALVHGTHVARERPGVATCASSTARARRSSPPARAAARRWACCAATIPTSRTSSTPRTRAT